MSSKKIKMVDLFEHMNKLNNKLQGKGIFVREMYSVMKVFSIKLRIFRRQHDICTEKLIWSSFCGLSKTKCWIWYCVITVYNRLWKAPELYSWNWLICSVTLPSKRNFNLKVLTNFMHYWIHPSLSTWETCTLKYSFCFGSQTFVHKHEN